MIKQILISIVILIITMNTFTNQDKLKTYNAFQEMVYKPLELNSATQESIIAPQNTKPMEFKLFSDHRSLPFPTIQDQGPKGMDMISDNATEKKPKVKNTLADMYKAKTLEDLLYAKNKLATPLLEGDKVTPKKGFALNAKLDKIDSKKLRSLTVENNPKELFEYYRKGLGMKESNNNYKEVNTATSSGTWGKYQLMGKYVEKDIKRITNATSMKDFLNKPKEQEKFFEWYYKNNLEPNLKRMKKEGYGKKFSDIELLGMIHFRGPSGARTAIAEGLNKKKESYNPTVNSYLLDLLNFANS